MYAEHAVFGLQAAKVVEKMFLAAVVPTNRTTQSTLTLATAWFNVLCKHLQLHIFGCGIFDGTKSKQTLRNAFALQGKARAELLQALV